jgi:hypothetical protein
MNPAIPAATFYEVERDVKRTNAYVQLAKTSKHLIESAVLTWQISRKLEQFVKRITPQWIEALPSEKIVSLTQDIQSLHGILAEYSSHGDTAEIGKLPLFGSCIKSLQQSTEDIGDIIEDLVLSQNEQYQSLVRQCADNLGLVDR